jgi:hypothetical protein
MENILSNKYITSNKKDINTEIKKELKINVKNLNEKSEDEDEKEIDTKVFNGLLFENKRNNTNTNNTNSNNNIITTKEKKNTRNFDAYINENNNLIDLNFISFGDVNSLYNFQNGKSDINSNRNKITDPKNKNNNVNININTNTNNDKSSLLKNKLNLGGNALNNSPEKVKNGSDESDISSSIRKNKRKNSNGSLINTSQNLNNNDSDNNEEENAIFLNKQIFKMTNLFGDKNKKENNKEMKKEIVRNYWESKNYFKISEINKGNAVLVSEDDNIINFPAFLLPKGAKLYETYTFEIKSMDKGFIYKNKKANEIDHIQKKYLNPENNNNNN